MTSFNDEIIGNIRPEHLFGYSLEEIEKYKSLLEQKNIGKVGIIKHVAESKFPYSTGDVEHDKYYKECIPGVNSELALPMLVNENAPLAGVFNLMAKEKDFFSQATMEVYGKAVKKITDFYLQKKQFQTLLKISGMTDNFLISQYDVYRGMATALQEYFKSDYVSVWRRRHPDKPDYKLLKDATLPSFYDLYKKNNFLDAKTTTSDPISTQFKSLISIEKPDENEINRICTFCIEHGFKGYIALRVIADNKYQAFINVFSKREINSEEIKGYSETFLNSVARKASSAIMNSRFLYAIEAITSALIDRDNKTPLQAIVDKAYRLSPSADSVVLFVYQGEDNTITIGDAKAVGGNSMPEFDRREPSKKANLASYVIEHGSQYIDSKERMSQVAQEISKERDITKTFWHARGLKSVAAIRLEFGGRP
ncbi:MAG: hypothetical protein IPN76_18675 [Saprospiraceae bacterium]|nr:hypothetical protein [Saprospiraceae bacterium]